MTAGGPANATNVMALHIYIRGFKFYRFGFSAALSYVLLVIVTLVAAIQLKLMTSGDNRTEGQDRMSAAPFTKLDSKGGGIHWRSILVTLFNHSILILFTVIIVYPVLWMILASFKTPGELISNIWGLPADPAYQNYADAWEKAKLGRALLNSGIVSIGAVLVVVCLSSIAGYAFAKFSFRFSTVILLVMVFTMQAPVPLFPFTCCLCG